MGYMETFKSPSSISFSCVEMRVIHDPREVKNSKIEKTELMKGHGQRCHDVDLLLNIWMLIAEKLIITISKEYCI